MTLVDALVAARGGVRDGAAAIENLAHLLGSRRVGPRVLAKALPEVDSGFGALRQAIGALGAGLAELLGEGPGLVGTREVLGHATARLDALEREIAASAKDTLDARERLRLEATVRRASADLDALARLSDFACACAAPRTTALDLGEVLAKEPRQAAGGTMPIVARVEIRTTPALVGDARIVVQLLELAVLVVVRAGIEAPFVVADGSASEHIEIKVGKQSDFPTTTAKKHLRVLEVPLRSELPGAVEMIRAIAKKADIDVTFATDRRTVAIVI